MPQPKHREGTQRHKRKSLFTLSSLTQINPSKDSSSTIDGAQQKLRKRSSNTAPEPSALPGLGTDLTGSQSPTSLHSSPSVRRPSLTGRSAGVQRTSSVFGSLRSLRSNEDEPASSQLADAEHVPNSLKVALHYGEVQTSGSMFRKKREYLVLTDSHIIRFKNHSKAVEVFHNIPTPFGRSPTIRHSSSQSVGSAHDAQSFNSDSSGDKEGKVSLRQIVAVHTSEEGKPYYGLEVCYLDQESNQASAVTMQFATFEEREGWLSAVRAAVSKARQMDLMHVNNYNTNYAARVVEREGDYDPQNFSVYKVVQRHQSKTGNRSSTDDLSKLTSVVCYLAVGIHKVHLIPLAKTSSRSSSPALNQTASGSFGILTISAIQVSSTDDSIELTFRQPLKRARPLFLASSASHDIAVKIHSIEHWLRPECAHWLYKFVVPPAVEAKANDPVDSSVEEHNCFERTLTAYCIAYDVNPSKIRYGIDYECEDAPRFELFPVADSRRTDYSVMELLAILRALRYNESFASICLADRSLDGLHSLYDTNGVEYVCVRTTRGTPLNISSSRLSRSSLLVQEVRALAATSKKLRRLDFSNCIRARTLEASESIDAKAQDVGCGIAEALFPLCRHQTTDVDWIILNGIPLTESDLDYLVGAAVDRNCHFRALELSRCGLHDRTLGLVLDALRAHDNTLEALDISGNAARLSPNVFDGQISVFGFIRRLDMSNLSRTSGPEPLLAADTLLTWRLETLKVSGVSFNERSVDALATYLRSTKSLTLKELILDNAYLSSSDISKLMEAMHIGADGATRSLHLDISHNNIYRDHEKLCDAFVAGHSPTHVTLRAMEYRDEVVLRNLLKAICQNRSTKYLDLSRASLPGDAGEETSLALRRVFAENDTLEEIDISGEDSRLETSKFGPGLHAAFHGLKGNTTLTVLRVQFQKLGLPGANALAEVLKSNLTLREVHCEHNEVPLSAFTDLVNALHQNTTLIYLPNMDEGRNSALKQTERQVKQIRDEASYTPSQTSGSSKKTAHLTVRRGLANVKRNVGLASPVVSPSFPSLNNSDTRLDAAPRGYSNTPGAAPLPQLSEQDVIAALRLVAESWDRQQYRLHQYLQRNWCLLQGIDVPMSIEEEEFERPPNVNSLATVIDKVKVDSTPTAERPQLDFAMGNDSSTTVMGSADRAVQGRHPSAGEHDALEPSVTIDGIPAASTPDTSSSITSPKSTRPDEALWFEKESTDSNEDEDALEIRGLGIKTPTKELYRLNL